MKKYVDLLAVRPMNGGPLDMVLAQSSKAHPGDLVSYDGKMGKVERVAWIGELEGETATLYEEHDKIRTPLRRGHGHIIHDGELGIAQAASYACRRLYESLGGTCIPKGVFR